ncbi:hypothetical protein [Marinobacterium arenosum]|uniref:hypothetical protein n=1 Tax=Marinobacterium arenosum TaxID=2862496 RepID=UPI001C94FD0F|nr:hypothetical protein [Marinobacterium arenosum]MBY4675335.1 hypothetical protein [Marinobacterium arenosum]
MIIQSTSARYFTAESLRASSSRQNPAATTTNFAENIHMSRPAQEIATLASSIAVSDDKSVEEKLAAIKAKDAVSRTQEDQDYLFANDKKLAEITSKSKSSDQLTAEELDYMQKAGGFVNTMANLSPKEKALYNKAVASGDTEAAAGISQIALIRMMGHMAGGANGETYDPLRKEITAANIEKYFCHSIVDPTGKAQSQFQFQALIQYLENTPDV